MKNLVWLISFFALLLAACGNTAAATQQSVLWTMDTSDPLDGWQLSIDGSVGCKELPPAQEDIGLLPVNNVLVLQANRLQKPGMFVNAIAHRGFEFQGSGQYILRGNFAIPSGPQLEIADAALEFVVDGVGHYAEIIYGQNPYVEDLYGQVYTRTTDWQVPVKINLGIDNKWHSFLLVATVDVENDVFVITKFGVDSLEATVNVPMVRVGKSWDSSFQVLLETHNMNPNCGSSNVTYGESQWDNISIEFVPAQP